MGAFLQASWEKINENRQFLESKFKIRGRKLLLTGFDKHLYYRLRV